MMKRFIDTALITLVFAALVAVSAYAQTTFTFPQSPSGILFGTEGTLNSFGQPTNRLGGTSTGINAQPGGTPIGSTGPITPGRVYSGGTTGSLYDPGILSNQYGGYGSQAQGRSTFTLPSTQFGIRDELNTFGRNESTSPFTASPTRPFTPPETSPFGGPSTSPFVGPSTSPFGGSSTGSFGTSSPF